ncbi:hypothetical protein DPMN_004236 [Dreissena polymorpha]|uniref:Uncharacterized protein n=1 Tax=Dreissena polymorpha TaxID=45954 RepID=A0A9D4MQX6_DREPO|nr:hypothetical protein DPMN_004236 [Dreissena polymorpha]
MPRRSFSSALPLCFSKGLGPSSLTQSSLLLELPGVFLKLDSKLTATGAAWSLSQAHCYWSCLESEAHCYWSCLESFSSLTQSSLLLELPGV